MIKFHDEIIEEKIRFGKVFQSGLTIEEFEDLKRCYAELQESRQTETHHSNVRDSFIISGLNRYTISCVKCEVIEVDPVICEITYSIKVKPIKVKVKKRRKTN